GYRRHAMAIGSVDGYQEFPAARDDTGENGLNRKCTGSLHQYGFIGAIGSMTEFQEPATNVAYHREELLIAGSQIAQHALFHGLAGRKWTRREEKFLAHWFSLLHQKTKKVSRQQRSLGGLPLGRFAADFDQVPARSRVCQSSGALRFINL